MIDHFGFVVKDLQTARRFYDACLPPLGLQTIDNSPQSFIVGRSTEEPLPFLWIGTQRPNFWPSTAHADEAPTHVAFRAPDEQAVDEFHRAALSAGGKNNGDPGPRDGVAKYYGAFVIDPDGNNIEACYRGE